MDCIKLMIVVAIIGILAASSCRSTITDMVQNSPIANLGTALASSCTIAPTKMVTSGSADADGVITVKGNSANLGGETTTSLDSITLTPMIDTAGTVAALKASADGMKTIQGWKCGPATVSPMPIKYLPGSCQGTY